MSFKKSKIASSEHTDFFSSVRDIHEQYRSLKRRNLVSGILLGFFGVSCITVLSFTVFDKLPDFNFHFSGLSMLNLNLNPFQSKQDSSQEEKINILVTGIGGAGHDGADLTDTILFVSINPLSKTVSLLSIPRDLYVKYPRGGEGKLNEIYLRGKQATKSEADGMKDLEDKIREMTGEKTDYYVNLDFDGFVKFVDLLGWIDVNVTEDLVDTEYPAWEDQWYTTFSIKKGQQVLDGATALKYARSRHSTSDFDRSRRQQLVIKAIKEKLLSLDYLSSPSKLKALYYTVSSHIKTDLDIGKILGLALFAREVPSDHILAFNLNDSCFQGLAYCQRGGFLYTPVRDLFHGASVLLPDGATPGQLGAYDEISKFTNLTFNYPEMFLESQEINVVNSTKSSGIANKVALDLKKYGFNVPDKNSIGSTKEVFPKSEIFYTWDAQNSVGIDPKSKTLEALSLFFFSPQTATPNVKYSKDPRPKIEIVLGKDYKLFTK